MALHAPFFVLLHRRVQSRWPYREEAMHAASAATLDSSRRTNTNLEGALVEQMATGDVEALGVLCDRWADAVRALVVRIVSDEADADDVVEAVFWQAWCQAPPARGCSPWLAVGPLIVYVRGGDGARIYRLTARFSTVSLRSVIRSPSSTRANGRVASSAQCNLCPTSSGRYWSSHTSPA
jgi:hypothetical protein